MDTTSYLLGKKAGGGTQPTGTINITENGIVNVSSYASADVNVQPTLQNKNVSITTNGSTSVSADDNYNGLDTVSITTNVQPNLESKSITITENTTTTITPTTGKDGLSSVEVITEVSGGGGPDWSEIGYSTTSKSYTDTQTEITNGFNYAKNIYDNWDTSSRSYQDLYKNDTNLKYFPAVATNTWSMYGTFSGCSNLEETQALTLCSDCREMFYSCPKLKYVGPLSLPTTGSNIQARRMFYYCPNLKSVSISGKVTDAREMFKQCYALEDITKFDLGVTNSTYHQNMFQNCEKLTDTSLDNILQMCAEATGVPSNKTLAYLGLSSTYYPASRIQALPHYTDFTTAGWTIGY